MGDVAVDGLPAKNLMGQPWRAAFALQDDGWILRSAIVWHKPNPMPESVSDRPTSAYEMVFLLTKRAHYFYDADAIRQPLTGGTHARRKDGGHVLQHGQDDNDHRDTWQDSYVPTSANARNVWVIPTQGRPEAHFATFPDELPRRCILAGTSEHGVCADCGAPWDRQTDSETIDTRPKSAGRNIDRVGGMSRGENFNNGDIRRGVKHNPNRRLATRMLPQRRPRARHRPRPLHRQRYHHRSSTAARTPRHRPRPEPRLPGHCRQTADRHYPAAGHRAMTQRRRWPPRPKAAPKPKPKPKPPATPQGGDAGFARRLRLGDAVHDGGMQQG